MATSLQTPTPDPLFLNRGVELQLQLLPAFLLTIKVLQLKHRVLSPPLKARKQLISPFIQAPMNQMKHVVDVVSAAHLLEADNGNYHHGNNDHQACGGGTDDERQLILHRLLRITWTESHKRHK